MSNDIPNVPITTLAGVTSLTDCKFLIQLIKFSFCYVKVVVQSDGL